MRKNEPKLLFFKPESSHKAGEMTFKKWRHISVENYFQAAALWFSDFSLNFDEGKYTIEKQK